VLSTFTLEADARVMPSPLADELDLAGLEHADEPLADVRVFEHEALAHAIVVTDGVPDDVRRWAGRRAAAIAHGDPRFHGATASHASSGYSLSALERYQDCPFKFFAADVLRLQEPPEDESALSPRARGRFIHEVFQRFFAAWDARGGGTIAPARIDEARALCAEVAEPLLAALPGPDAALERTRLFGSAISVGIVEVVLGLEASRPADVRERWLEYRLEGEFSLGRDDGRRVSLRGVADRIDLLAGRRLRVIDYKSGAAPNPRRALQVPIYGLCAQERLMERDLAPWAVDGAAYVAFSGKRPLATVVKPGGADAAAVLDEARERLFGLVDGIGRGEFPPRPHDPMICRYCAYSPVCRKDYVGDE
jgi:ATP-dependent helicase/nuclease subunit B